jgi:hypothetical protein
MEINFFEANRQNEKGHILVWSSDKRLATTDPLNPPPIIINS